jgi:Na+-driven multidrug efflux pump
VFGLPFAYVFAFTLDLGLEGLWFGIAVAAFIQAISYYALLLKADWEQIATQVKES